MSSRSTPGRGTSLRLAVISAALLVVAAPGLRRLQVDNSPEGFFPRDHRALESHRRLRVLFGPDRSLRVVASGEGLWTADGLAWLGRLEEEITALPAVVGAVGLSAHHRPRLGTWPPPDPEGFRSQVRTNRLDRNAGWVDATGGSVSLLVVLYDVGPPARRSLLADLESRLAAAPPGVTTRLVGVDAVERAFDAEVAVVPRRVLPLLALLELSLLALVLRRVADVAVVAAPVVIAQLVALGAMGYAGARIDLVTVLVLPVVLVIALTTGIHVVVRFRHLRRRPAGVREAVAETYREKTWPVLWAGVTTTAAFASLVVARVPAVQHLGAWSAAGIAVSTLLTFTLLPALLALPGPGPAAGVGYERRAREWGRSWAAAAVRRRRWVLLAFAVGGLAALAGASRLHLDTGLLSYLPPDHPVRADLEAVEADGIGAVAAELVLEARGERGAAEGAAALRFDSPAGLAALERLAAELRRLPGVLGVVGAGDLVADAEAWAAEGAPPGEAAGRTLARMRADRETEPLLAAVLARDGAAARLTLFLPIAGFDELAPALEGAAGRGRAAFPGASVTVTGTFPLLLAAQRSLLETMLGSLVLTLVVVAAAFWLALGDVAQSLAALVANLWPVAVAVGAMGWLGVPLDSSTVAVAAVLLGLAVDDTLHAFGAFRRRPVGDPGARVVAALRTTAPGHLLTALLLVAGFGLCALTPFVPIRRFSGVMVLGLLGALAADLLLVPALLAGSGGRRASAAPTATPAAGRGA